MKIVLVGNQNSGKTTIFNYLTGLNQKIGNWSGVTVDYYEGKIKNTNHILVDLPGIYSLSPYSVDEEVTINYLFNNKIDLIVNVIDINYLNRSLYLTTQLKDLGYKMVLIFTMMDGNIIIDNNKLERLLGLTVIDINKLKCIDKLNNYSYKNNFKLSSQERYNYIDKICKEVIIKNKKNNYLDLDNILLNKYFSIPIFIIMMIFIYYLSFSIVGIYIQKYINIFMSIISNKILYLLKIFNISNILTDLIINGIIKGIKSIVCFFPQLIIIFTFMSIIKQTGYIARISVIFNNLFLKIGLCGKSIISFILGNGCSVTGIISSRIIEDNVKREKTIFLIPFIPCSAKVLVIIMIYSSFFYEYIYFPVLVYLLSFLIIIIISIIMKKIYKITDDYYIMELPKYRLPKLSYILKDVIDNVVDFIKRIGSTIIISSIIIWLLLSFSVNFNYIENVNNSILYSIGNKISFLFYPFLKINSWELTIPIIEGLIAKEQIVSALSIISKELNLIVSKKNILSFLTFNLFSIPCINTLVAIYQELNNMKKTLFILLFYFFIGFFISVIIYQIGDLIW